MFLRSIFGPTKRILKYSDVHIESRFLLMTAMERLYLILIFFSIVSVSLDTRILIIQKLNK